jgi:hypothetical protein
MVLSGTSGFHEVKIRVPQQNAITIIKNENLNIIIKAIPVTGCGGP